MATYVSADASGASRTSLCAAIPDAPWLPEYELGAGVDVIGASVKPSPFLASSTVAAKASDQKTAGEWSRYTLVKSEKDIDTHLNVSSSASATGLLPSFSASTGMEYISNVQCSENTITLIFKSERLCDEYESIHPTFTPEAEEILKENPDDFRRMHGDYYVAGRKKGAFFVALFVLKSSSTSAMNQLQSNASLTAKLFSVETKATKEGKKVLKNVDISAYIFKSGVNSDAASPCATCSSVDDVRAAYEDFSKSVKYTDSIALLRHYQYLVPAYPLTINIPPDAFTEIQDILVQMKLLKRSLRKVHKNYRPDVEAQLHQLVRKVESHKASLLCGEKRAEFLRDTEELRVLFDEISSRQAFYEKMVKEKAKEKHNTTFSTDEKYGIINCEPNYSPGVTVTEVSKSFLVHKKDEKSKKVGQSGQLIVGWAVSCQQKKKKWMAPSALLLSETATLELLTAGWWEVTVWLVPASDYKFE